jgi:hypothetical protein
MKRVRLEDGPDLVRVIEEVHADRTPRAIERDGEVLAVIVGPEEAPTKLDLLKSSRNLDEILKFAGVWADLDADRMIENIHRWRREAPPSPPVSFE